ncbi:hypothetical protein EVAR_29121_1 [Eumeta japonica]|uniref:Uncharacterized protein n=1 Tax=Eumeta variegata TaxID=151549 RepID=A0A4C1VML3_EUMVA|nr:hypothetical protein EVAR_29121_1 [Eumeta japonica]
MTLRHRNAGGRREGRGLCTCALHHSQSLRPSSLSPHIFVLLCGYRVVCRTITAANSHRATDGSRRRLDITLLSAQPDCKRECGHPVAAPHELEFYPALGLLDLFLKEFI